MADRGGMLNDTSSCATRQQGMGEVNLDDPIWENYLVTWDGFAITTYQAYPMQSQVTISVDVTFHGYTFSLSSLVTTAMQDGFYYLPATTLLFM